MSIVIKDLKKNEELDRQAVMRFCRGGKKQAAGFPFEKPSDNDLKERLLKACDSQAEDPSR
ncbi:MAG: hypothetical protein L0Y38_03130 [Methylococcaceae bacterium]|nr:hypothetical protein [Methylococcaceae bacterium]